jgi:hypothetical protein
MSKSTTGLACSPSRGAILLNTVSIAAGGFILRAPAAYTALAKLTHQAAKYQDTLKDPEMLDLHAVCDATPPRAKSWSTRSGLTAGASFTQRSQLESGDKWGTRRLP